MTLIERIEDAPEGSRELSDECLLTVGWTESEIMYADLVRPDGKMINRANCPDPSRNVQDAIDWLVPEGWRSGFEQAGQFDIADICEAWCWPYDGGFDPDWQDGQQGYRDSPDGKRCYAATPALALCAAALRARETMKEQADAG